MRGILIMALLAASSTLGAMTTKHFDEYVPRDLEENVSYRAEMLNYAASDRSAQAQMRQMCAEDPLFYINTFCFSFSPKDSLYGDSRTPFTLYDFQCSTILEILDAIDRGVDCATPKSRGVGASWMCLTSIEWCWHFREFLSFLMVSRKESLVDDSGNPDALFWKVDYLHQYQPKWLLPTNRWLGRKDPGRKLLRLHNADNQSVLNGESTTGNIGISGRHTTIFFDEFALQEDGYAAIRGTRDVTNCRLGTSTPRGQNHFYEFCEKIAAKVLRLHLSKHDIFKRGLYTTDEVGKVKLLDDFHGMVRFRTVGEKDFRMVLYPDNYPFQSCTRFKLRSPWFDYECTRCADEKEIEQELEINFQGSEYQFFNPGMIAELKKRYCRPPLLIGDLEFDPVTLKAKRFTENMSGKLKLWFTIGGEGTIASDRRFVVGSDVSAGTGASNSCTSIVDRDTGEKVGVWKDSNTLPHLFADHTIALARWLNDAFLVGDRSGPTGEVFFKQIEKHGYSDIYYRRNEKRIGRPITDEPGVWLNPQQKSVVLHDYRDALNTHRFINRSETGMDECLQFVKKADGSVEHSAALNAIDPDGARTSHGDEVISDAMACIGLTERSEIKTPSDDGPPVGSLAWRMKMKRDDEMAKLVDCLGSNW